MSKPSTTELHRQPPIDIRRPAEQQKPMIAEPRKQSSIAGKPAFSFLPPGMIRSAAEHLAAAIAGALLLFVFFMASEAAVMLLKDTPLMPVTFIPVICLLPFLAGALSAIVLEKLRKAEIGVKRGALAGALAGALGSSVSSLPIIALAILNMNPLGEALPSALMVAAVMVAAIGLDTMLAALGGALVVKFTSGK